MNYQWMERYDNKEAIKSALPFIENPGWYFRHGDVMLALCDSDGTWKVFVWYGDPRADIMKILTLPQYKV